MIVYILITLSLLIFHFTTKAKSKQFKNRLLFVAICALILVQGFRSINVGVDLKSYEIIFTQNSTMSFQQIINHYNKEWLYHFLNKLVFLLHGDFRVIIFLVSILIFTPIYVILKDNAKHPFLSLLIFLFLGLFLFTLSGLRQTIAIGFTLFAFMQIKKQNIVKFILSVVVATLFHQSAFLFFLAYPLYHFNLTKNKLYFLLIPITILFIFRIHVITFLTKLYNDNYEITNTNAYNFLLLLIFFLVFSMIFVYNDKNKEKKGLINFLIFAVVIQIFASYSTIVMRFNYYFYIYLILLIPILFDSIKDRNLRILFSTITVVFLGSMFFLGLKDNAVGGYPYEFLFSHYKTINLRFE